jgi:hypothetical protein
MIVQAGREAIKSVPHALLQCTGDNVGESCADDEPPFLTGRGLSIRALF